jgi:DNA polymerase/3'-5' exonuclease PolX
MPKKTKQEKIIAQYRKKLKLLEQNSFNLPQIKKEPVNQKIDNFNSVNIPSKIPVLTDQKDSPELQTAKSNFVADFKKSLLLGLGIIALEIFLYFATINHYFKLF